MLKVDYEFKIDKRGYKYALKVNLETGKKQRIKYKLATKRASDLKYRRKRSKIEGELQKEGAGATYKEYKEMSSTIEKEIERKRIEQGKPALKKSVLRAKVKKHAIEYRTGIKTRFKYAWVYSIVIDRYKDETTGKIIKECDTPIFEADSHNLNGDHFNDMVEMCQEAYDDILERDLCTLDGGACVLLYNKSDKSIINKFELGKGCGFSFDFENYEKDTNLLTDPLYNKGR